MLFTLRLSPVGRHPEGHRPAAYDTTEEEEEEEGGLARTLRRARACPLPLAAARLPGAFLGLVPRPKIVGADARAADLQAQADH